MDYRLKSLYEQMLRGEPLKEAPKEEQPKSLTEAYNKTLLTERTAFYTKDLSTGEPIKYLGTVDQAERIKYLIASQSSLPEVEKLMTAAGNWSNVDNYKEDLLQPVASEMIAAGLTVTSLQDIIKEKSSLQSFSSKVNEQVSFNTMDAVVEDLIDKVDSLKNLSKEKLNNLYKYCFLKKNKISDVSVGFGEVVLSLFTNCKKGVVGDLDSETIGAIEVKTDGGRIAKKSQINVNYKEDLINFLTSQKATQKTSRVVSTLKNNIEEQIDKMKANSEFARIFTNKYEQYITNLIANIGTQSFTKKFSESPFAPLYRSTPSSNTITTFYSTLQKKGLITIPDKDNSAPIPESQKKYAYETHKNIADIFKNKKLQKDYEQTMGLSQAVVDLSKLSVWDSMQYFFHTDFGFTPDQLAQGLLLIVNSRYRDTAKQFLSEIIEVLSSNYGKSIKAGNIKALKGLIFAMQVAVYAQGGFKYLLVVNKTNFVGLGFDASSFKTLYQTYSSNSDRLVLDVDLDENRGGSAITIR